MAVLGGGAGGITAAFELTATPRLRERFDVTVYQPGWRLGGKGASGRNRALGQRIEEHGLHLWFGFYDNAFRLLDRAYDELGRPDAAPLHSARDAFEGHDSVVFYDRQGKDWRSFSFTFPPNLDRPGDSLPTFWEIAARCLHWAVEGWERIRDDNDVPLDGTHHGFIPDVFDHVREILERPVDLLWEHGGEPLLKAAASLAGERVRHTGARTPEHIAQLHFLAALVNSFREWLWNVFVKQRVRNDPGLRFYFTGFDTFASILVGIVEDDVLTEGFDSLNDYEWCDWLKKHGAKQVTVGRTPADRAPILRSIYDVAFGFPGGDIDKANVAAGTATHDFLRLLFSYRGHLYYKMKAGMGDVVFAPLYQVLRKRGVHFRFFHAATHLGLSDDGRFVDTIDVVPQVGLSRDRKQYSPLVAVKGLRCWPSEPLWEQLTDSEDLRRFRARDGNFERELNPLRNAPFRLHRGADFDQVVLAIPVGALEPICGELMSANAQFRRMVRTSVTVRTQAFQLWLRATAKDLGWDHDSPMAGSYVEPLDTYCDMSHLLPRESWPASRSVRSIAYVCGVMGEREGRTPEEADERVKQNALDFLRSDIGPLWPKAVTDENDPTSPLRWELLAAPAKDKGESRFDSQYWRANVTPSERYVLTPAKAVNNRLAADRSGFENVVLAGDWTKNGLDGGCFEAAVISGMQAARALTGHEQPILGEDPRWLRPT